MNEYISLIGLTLASSMAASIASADVDLERGPVVAPDAMLETVYDKGVWLEGPVQASGGELYLSDLTISFYSGGQLGAILAHDPVAGETRVVRSPSGMTNGLAFGPDGSLYAASGADFGCRCVMRTDITTGTTTIVAGTFDGRPFNAPNDLVVASDGTIYFSDPRYFGHEPLTQPVFGIYRVAPGGDPELVITDAARPNGLALSPDERILYVAENDIGTSDIRVDPPYRQGGMDILAYPLDDAGMPGARTVFVDMQGRRGADGLDTDSAGNLYATIQQADRQGIHVFSPVGKHLAMIPTPTMPTNVALVSVGEKTFLYATGGSSLYRIEVLTHRGVAE